MPELPDIVVYIEALDGRVRGRTLEAVHINHPFLLHSTEPAPGAAVGKAGDVLERWTVRTLEELEELKGRGNDGN